MCKTFKKFDPLDKKYGSYFLQWFHPSLYMPPFGNRSWARHQYTPFIKGWFFATTPTDPQSLFQHLVTGIHTRHLKTILQQHDWINTEKKFKIFVNKREFTQLIFLNQWFLNWLLLILLSHVSKKTLQFWQTSSKTRFF